MTPRSLCPVVQFALMSVLGACAITDPSGAPPAGPAVGQPNDIEPGLDAVHLVGRFDTSDPSSAAFAWSGSAIWTRFEGSALSIELSGAAWFDVEIDGVLQPALETRVGRAIYPIAIGLADGEHDVRVTRRTEAAFGVSRFYGFIGATLIRTEAPHVLFEMIGDAATAGSGVLGATPTCALTASTQAETRAWGAIAARELDSAHVALAATGVGIAESSGGGHDGLIPELFERTLPGDPDSVWDFSIQPDFVVLNVGGADYWQDDPGLPFIDAYQAFVEQVRDHYPDAQIILASSAVLREPKRSSQITALEKVVARETAAGDDRISFLELRTQVVHDHFGCGYQPSETTQAKMAAALVAKIRSLVLVK